MKNIAPHITRQRLLIEGYFSINVTEKTIGKFFRNIIKTLNLRAYGNPSIHVTGNQGKKINQGFDAFIPLIDSGIALYVWGNARFFSVVIYTCKEFSEKKAVAFIKKFFAAKSIVFMQF